MEDEVRLDTSVTFGPSDTDSPNSAELLKWRVKQKSNDELRQRFVNLTVAQAAAIDLTLPAPDEIEDISP